MDTMFDTLAARIRPEDAAQLVKDQLGDRADKHERAVLERATRGSLRRMAGGYTSMLQTFAGPRGMHAQVARAKTLFRSAERQMTTACDQPAAVEAFIRGLGAEIAKDFGASDFLADRLDGAERDAAGLDVSRRKYNRMFRHLRRMEVRLARMVREWMKFDFARTGKSGLATRITREDFLSSESAACFATYLTARANLRSEFTVSGQQRAFDEIAAMLYARCERDPATNWFVVAHVHPTRAVLARLTDDQKLRLLSAAFELLHRIAGLLRETWQRSHFVLATMIVQPGDDSTTWNNTASAWNKARDLWIALVYALGMDDLLDGMCVGKVMRLMAADVVAWHHNVGHTLDPNTAVWAALPAPWDVLTGRARATRAQVEAVCARFEVDPVKSGWTAARSTASPARFRPTPELVHGVTVANPMLATVLKQAGWFSGKPAKVASYAGQVLTRERDSVN